MSGNAPTLATFLPIGSEIVDGTASLPCDGGVVPRSLFGMESGRGGSLMQRHQERRPMEGGGQGRLAGH